VYIETGREFDVASITPRIYMDVRCTVFAYKDRDGIPRLVAGDFGS
jgi:hypothetical protein